MKIRGPNPRLWRGYRNCDKCTRWRPVSDFTVYRTRTGYEQIKGTCDKCKRDAERERYEKLTLEQKRAKGVKANEQAQKRRDSALHEIERLRKILDKQNVKLDKQYDKIERSRKIVRVPYGTGSGIAVDIIPFRMWLMRQYRQHDYNLGDLAKHIGQDPSRVRRWLDGYLWNGTGRDPEPIRSIYIANIDKIGVAVGDPGLLERLYPLEADDEGIL